MDAREWGPPAWKFLHCIPVGYTDQPTAEDVENYRQFYYYLGKVLPCSLCRNHYQTLDISRPKDADLLNRDTLAEWTDRLHRRINSEREPLPEKSGCLQWVLFSVLLLLILISAIVLFYIYRSRQNRLRKEREFVVPQFRHESLDSNGFDSLA